MGTWRFILSILVLLFHCGMVSGASGPSAVFGFYLLSGYLIPLAIEKNYGLSWSGVVRYYINRGLRVYPLYIFFMGLTVVLIAINNGSVYYLKTLAIQPLSSEILQYKTADYINELFFNTFIREKSIEATAAVFLNGFPKIIPQAWSISVEWIFYLTAPFILISYQSKKINKFIPAILLLFSMFFATYTYFKNMDWGIYGYRSVFGCFFIFLIGFFSYKFGLFRNSTSPHRYKIFILLIAAYIPFVCLTYFDRFGIPRIYSAIILQFFIVALGMTLNYRSLTFDRKLGELSYGIFIGQFFVIMLMTAITADNSFSSFRGLFSTRGSLQWGLWCLALTIAISYLSNLIIERYIGKIRDKVRG